MLTKLQFKNFKCFQDTGTIDIKPLTFLVGANSAGKTSFLQMLLMLRQTAENPDPTSRLATNGAWVEMGAYPEFVFGGDYKRELYFKINFSVTKESTPLNLIISKNFEKGKSGEVDLEVEACFKYNRRQASIVLLKNEVKVGNKPYTKLALLKKSYDLTLFPLEENKFGDNMPLVVSNVEPYKFYGHGSMRKVFNALAKKSKNSMDPLGPIPIGFAINNELDKIFYLGPLRDFPRRIYVAAGHASKHVGIKGEEAIGILWHAHNSRNKRLKKVEREVKKWLERFGFASNIRLDRVSAGNYYRFVVIDPETNTEVNLADIGFGASQALPIIIEGLHAPSDSLVLVEQPEIHLHPRAQAVMGDFLVDVATTEDRAFVVETHSEHLLSRVRRRIAEGKIKPENVAIYYFQPGNAGTEIKKIGLTDEGFFKDFPEGFFEEEIQETFEHFKVLSLREKK